MSRNGRLVPTMHGKAEFLKCVAALALQCDLARGYDAAGTITAAASRLDDSRLAEFTEDTVTNFVHKETTAYLARLRRNWYHRRFVAVPLYDLTPPPGYQSQLEHA